MATSTMSLPVFVPRSSSSSSSSASGTPCACSKTYNLTVEQGATLSSQITLSITDKTTGVKSPVDVTGANFQFTAKLDINQPDSDPGTIKVDWQETSTPTQGITWLKIPATITFDMELAGYSYQVRMVSSSGVVTPLFKGTLTVTQPVSARH